MDTPILCPDTNFRFCAVSHVRRRYHTQILIEFIVTTFMFVAFMFGQFPRTKNTKYDIL